MHESKYKKVSSFNNRYMHCLSIVYSSKQLMSPHSLIIRIIKFCFSKKINNHMALKSKCSPFFFRCSFIVLTLFLVGILRKQHILRITYLFYILEFVRDFYL